MTAERKKPRSKRRADGTMRPSVKRHRAKRARAARRAWLNEFAPGVRKAFFDAVDLERAAFARPFARKTGMSAEEAEKTLAALAERTGWLTLTTRSGRVVGIGPRRG